MIWSSIFPGNWPATVNNNQDNNLMNTRESSTNDMVGTTQILNEIGVKTVSREHLTDIPRGLLGVADVGYKQNDVRDFLKKPIILATVTWAAQAAGDVLVNSSLPIDAFAHSIYADKLSGFLAFRGTAIIRVQVNGTRFQAGRLLLVFIPQGNVAGSYPGMRLRSLTSMTQLPRVELDISSETEVVMEIPYISPTPFYNLQDFSGPMGRAVLAVYSPLATGTGSTTADITVWISFKDVQLEIPVAQMADRQPKGRKKKKNTTEAELEIYGDKPISSGLMSLSEAASSFARIPMLSSLAAPASWALAALSGAASAFGYSKPGTEVATTKVYQAGNFNMQNCNGVDMFPNLSLDASNKMSVLPGFAGTDVDEMTLNHLVQIPAYFSSLTWYTTDAEDTTLANFTMSPNLGVTSAVHSLWATKDHTPLSYFSGFFKYWRGSLAITFKIVKTDFHSGRLLIAYTPAGAVTTIEGSAYGFREIVDIRENSEFKFVIPFCSTVQYKKTLTHDSATLFDDIGIVTIKVLNELVAPDTVAASVKILCEISAGPDFELSCPAPYNIAPIMLTGWATQMADIVPASKDSSEANKNQDMIGIGSANIKEQSLDGALYCVGEKANSILQLLKRYTNIHFDGDSNAVPSREWRCFTYGAVSEADLVGFPEAPTSDYMSMFALCYAYSRGAVRVMVSPPLHDYWAGGTYVVWSRPEDNNTNVLANVEYPAGYQPGISKNVNTSSSSKVYGATVPAYQRLHARLNRPSTLTLEEPVDVYTSAMRFGATTYGGGSNRAAYWSRSAADDFGLGYFIGVPLVTTTLDLSTGYF